MSKNKLVSFLIVCMCSTMVIGCNKEKEETVTEVVIETEEKNMFGLTETEQKMYAEYAAGVLMKYNAGSNMRVLEGQKLINQEAKEEAAREQAARREQLAAEYAANKSQSNKTENQTSGSGTSGSSQESGVSYVSDMAVATGMNSFTITYSGYEITDSYPSSGEDMLLAIDAGQEKTLLITKFLVSNISGQMENFDMFSKQAKFKVNLNGANYKAQYTLLLDDLSMYKGDIEAGAIVDTVLVFEIPESVASNLGDMVLSVTTEDGTSSMRLRGGSVTQTETAEPAVQESMDNSEDSEQTETGSEDTEPESENESGEGGNVTVIGSDSN